MKEETRRRGMPLRGLNPHMKQRKTEGADEVEEEEATGSDVDELEFEEEEGDEEEEEGTVD
jgi:hypothetical protein